MSEVFFLQPVQISWVLGKPLTLGPRRYWDIYLSMSQELDISMEEVEVLVDQLCPTLCDPMDDSPPGSSVYGISQARILEWVAIPFSRGSSLPRDWTQVSCFAGRIFTIWATHLSMTMSISVFLLYNRLFMLSSSYGKKKKKKYTPVFLPGKFHGQRSLGSQRVGHDSATDCTHTHTHTHLFVLLDFFFGSAFSHFSD